MSKNIIVDRIVAGISAVIWFLCILFSLTVFASLPPEQQKIADDLSFYMNGLEHVRADFTQFSGQSVSHGIAVIDPKSISVEYLSPKHISITYSKTDKNTVLYYDHRLNQERYIRVQLNALNLLLEDDWQKAVIIKRIDVLEDIYVAHVIYDNDLLMLSFSKNPITLKGISVTGKIHNKRSTINLEFSDIKRMS